MLGVQLVAIQHKNFEMIEAGIRYAIQNENIKGIYVIPDFHNPTSHIMSLETRKMIAPGLRTAFIYVPEKYHRDLAVALYNMNISNPALLASISADLIINGIADEIIMERKNEISNHNLIANEILNGYLVESELTCPIRYLLLPDYFTGKRFEICALQAGVQVFGAERFMAGNKPADKTARISIITPIQ